MRKQLIKIIEEAEAEIKNLGIMVRPALNDNNDDGKIVVEAVFKVSRNAIMKASLEKIIDCCRRQNIVPNRSNRTRKKQRLTRLQRRTKRQR